MKPRLSGSFTALALLASFWFSVLSLTGCSSTSHTRKAEKPPLLLISLDAFRWDYVALHPAETPHLQKLIREGTSAKGLIPAYPSNTFANHYSIVTGLYPSHHGIINNDFFDPALGAFFNYKIQSIVQDGRWWGGEPIWATAIKQGHVANTSFWVGSEAEIGGLRPTVWRAYDPKVPFEHRLEELIGWLSAPAAQRPAVIAFYLEETNSIGHKFGPNSPELTAAIQLQDERLGAILGRLDAEHVATNIVILSDHGLTPISLDRIILLDDFLDPRNVQVDFDGPAAGLRPRDGNVTAMVSALDRLQHAKAYRLEDLPARFHVSPNNPRNPPVWIVPEEGWEIYFRSHFEVYRNKFNKGEHGYDPAFASMRGIFIAWGPSINRGVVVDALENIHVYNFLCAAAGLKPAPNDGDDRLVRAGLR